MARGVRRFVREPDSLEACHAAFEAAYAVPTYGAEVYRWSAYLDGDLQLMFESDVARVLGREQLVVRHFARMVARFGFRGTPERDARAWQGAGNAAGWGVRLVLLREDLTPTGEPGWRLVRGEPTWVVEDGRPVQIRGLPPEAQAARYQREASLAKRRATLDRKARAAAAGPIGRLVAGIVESDPATAVAAHWHERGPVPEWAVGRPVSGVAPTVVEAHEAAALDRAALVRWQDMLSAESGMASARQWSARLAAPAPSDAVPAEDVDALDGLR